MKQNGITKTVDRAGPCHSYIEGNHGDIHGGGGACDGVGDGGGEEAEEVHGVGDAVQVGGGEAHCHRNHAQS